MSRSRLVLIVVGFLSNLTPSTAQMPGPADWASYNHDPAGWRFNRAETRLSPKTVSGLVERWRFPRQGDGAVGCVQMTPAVVDGEVYFGTVMAPTFYKLSAEGEKVWEYPNRRASNRVKGPLSPAGSFLASPLVTDRVVFAADISGNVFCLDRATGKERWFLDTRAEGFPGAHESNAVFASPILAEGTLIIAGGAFEHQDATKKGRPCCRGRGFVMALEPDTGKLIWKYDVGPKPKKLDPPVTIKDAFGEHTFEYGPSTSSVWCTPSFDAETHTLYFGTDVHNSPRRPTSENPRHDTLHAAAVIAIDSRTGREKWVTQVNRGDVWNYAMRAYDPITGFYKDQSIGDTPKIMTIQWKGTSVKVVGCGGKNGSFHVLRADDGTLLAQTPIYRGPPSASPKVDPRTLALPGPIGGLQTGCATDGKRVFTNGIDSCLMFTDADPRKRLCPPTGGRVTCLSPDTRYEFWRHERPKVAKVGIWQDVGDPVGSGIALANGVAFFTTTVSNQLVALDTASGKVLKQIDLGPVWCGPSVSRGRVYVGLGNVLFSPPSDSYFPKRIDGGVVCFGLPED